MFEYLDIALGRGQNQNVVTTLLHFNVAFSLCLSRVFFGSLGYLLGFLGSFWHFPRFFGRPSRVLVCCFPAVALGITESESSNGIATF